MTHKVATASAERLKFASPGVAIAEGLFPDVRELASGRRSRTTRADQLRRMMVAASRAVRNRCVPWLATPG